MNLWTEKSIALAGQSNYLDQLYRVYPMSLNLRRELSPTTQTALRACLEQRDGLGLLRLLLQQEIFPLKDSYVAYLRRDPGALERNPATVNRLAGLLLEMGFAEILEKTTVPKETNRQIGPLFKRWLESGTLGVATLNTAADFLSHSGDAVFTGSDGALQALARQQLGYQHDKGLDFLARFNGTYVLGEAKFLSDFGGHQNAQFNDALATLRAPLAPTPHRVRTVAILDGVLYIPGRHRLFSTLQSFSAAETVLSALLLRDFLYSL